MLRNIVILTLRTIKKDRAYNILNIAGLTIGVTCCVFLLLYILDELSYDRYHKNADNIYRIVTNIREPQNEFTWAVAQVPMAEELLQNYPEVKNAVRFFDTGRGIIRIGEKQFQEDNFFLADSAVFDMFSYEFLAGDPSSALVKPYAMVLTESIAKKYFGDALAAFGQSIQNIQGEEFQITAVIRNVPFNSHFRFDGLVSRVTVGETQGSWSTFGVFTYIQLPEGYDLSRMKANLDKIAREKVAPHFEGTGITVSYDLQRITDIHLYSKIQDETEAGGDISYIYVFGTAAMFVLVIACINYINLATARSAERAKEISIRKIMGSHRTALMLQFLTESILLSVISLFFSFILMLILFPAFNDLTGKHLSLSHIFQFPVIISLSGIVFFIGIAGGWYPAFYLSGFSPVNVLKGKLITGKGGAGLRKFLVIFQFSVSIFMLVSTLLVFDQLQFLRNKDLGFDKEKIIRLNLTGPDSFFKASVLSERLDQLAEVSSVGFASTSPGKRIGKLLFKAEDEEGKMTDRSVDLFVATFDFIKTMGMEIIEGRDFSRERISDTSYAVIVNEAMVRRMGWKNPIGKKLVVDGSGAAGQEIQKKVIGVIKNYHQNSLYSEIEPLIIVLGKTANYAFIRIGENDPRHTLQLIETNWKELFPGSPFQYSHLNEDFNSQYKPEEKRSEVFSVFSVLTIAIACLGLLGLAAFTTERRTKEIGLRKIAGASVNSLVLLISREFLWLIGISMAVAFPLTWHFTNYWLQSFAYRIQVASEWLVFVVSALMVIVIAFSTIGYHIVRVANTNPINTLRNE